MRRCLVVGVLGVAVGLAGCGGSGNTSTVSSASLQPRLLPASAVPGFGLQRQFDWSNPVNLVVQGVNVPESVYPSAAVDKFTAAHVRGGAGEFLANGSGPQATVVRIGVAQFDTAADANTVRAAMHRYDLMQPCLGKCIFTPAPAVLAGIPNLSYVVQSTRALPPGAPRFAPKPANYLAEFTIGPYLYFAALNADDGARSRFEQGLRLYYAHAKQQS